MSPRDPRLEPNALSMLFHKFPIRVANCLLLSSLSLSLSPIHIYIYSVNIRRVYELTCFYLNYLLFKIVLFVLFMLPWYILARFSHPFIILIPDYFYTFSGYGIIIIILIMCVFLVGWTLKLLMIFTVL